MLSGPQARIYSTWDEIKTILCDSPTGATCKGYYSLEEALSLVRASVCPNYFISTLLKGKSS